MQMQFAPRYHCSASPIPGTIGVARAESGQFDTILRKILWQYGSTANYPRN